MKPPLAASGCSSRRSYGIIDVAGKELKGVIKLVVTEEQLELIGNALEVYKEYLTDVQKGVSGDATGIVAETYTKVLQLEAAIPPFDPLAGVKNGI